MMCTIISLRTQGQQQGLNFSLVDRLLDSEQELHHRCEGRSFVSQLFAPTFLVVTEEINTLEFLVVTILTIYNKRKTNDDDNV